VASAFDRSSRRPSLPDVWGKPAYSIADAARYVLVPTATLRSWVAGRFYPTRAEARKRFEPIIRVPEAGSPWLLSFRNLAEAHVLATLRRHHKVKLETIRRAVRYMERKFQDQHPLINPGVRTDGVDLFLEQFGSLEGVSKEGQLAMKTVLESSLARLDWGREGSVLRLFPFTRLGEREGVGPRLVVIDPRVSFGKPVIVGTRIPTKAIFDRWTAGDSVEDLAKDFACPTLEVEEAIRCEQQKVA
jgi:uncharacterized protein (DUF433 family)